MGCADDLFTLGSSNTSINLPEGDMSEVSEPSLCVQRNKSTGNLFSKTQETADRGPVRYSIHAGTTQELNMAK
jgi:hypothetical protein